jgi:hypothetical protein
MAKPEDKPNDDLKQLKADMAALSAQVSAIVRALADNAALVNRLIDTLAMCEARQRRHHAACPCPAQW